jgi:glycerol-3-phosphate acyltransferase PlsY
MNEMILFAIVGYLIGAIPFGLILTRFAGYGDIRSIGSGNIGATNVLRTGNKKLAALTLLLDGGKGAVAVLIAKYFGTGYGLTWGDGAAFAAAAGALFGHMFPVWLKFKGGKGVATTLGILLALAPFIGIAACATWLLTAFITKYSSLSALVAVAVSAGISLYGHFFIFPNPFLVMFTLLAVVLVFFKHSGNIARLLDGTEPKIGQKKADA